MKLATDYAERVEHSLYGGFDLPVYGDIQSRADELLSDFDHASTLPNSSNRFRGLSALVGGFYTEAIDSFRVLYQRQPQDKSAGMQLAEAYSKANRSEAAIELWRRLGSQRSFSTAAFHGRSAALDLDEREHYFALAAVIAPQDVEVYRKWMEFYDRRENWAAVARIWRLASEAGVQDGEVFHEGASAYRLLGDEANARMILEQSLRFDPPYPLVFTTLAGMHWKSGDEAAALQLINRLKKACPEDGLAYFVLGNFYYKSGRFAQALPELEMSVRLGWVNADVYERIGVTQFHLEDYQGALQVLEQARELQQRDIRHGPSVPDYRRTRLFVYLGAAHWRLGHSSQAQNYVCQALEIAGDPAHLPQVVPSQLLSVCGE